MGAISNNSRKLANFAGFYKGIQSAVAAIIWRLDGLHNPPPYMNLFAPCWVLLAGSLVIALPAMILEIKDNVPIEEDLKFTDEAIEDVICRRFEWFLLGVDDHSRLCRFENGFQYLFGWQLIPRGTYDAEIPPIKC